MSALNKLLPAILLAYVADVPCTLTSDECNEREAVEVFAEWKKAMDRR